MEVEVDHVKCYNLMQEAIVGESSMESILGQLGGTLAAAQDKDIVYDLIADAVFQCDIETDPGDNKDKRNGFIELLRELVKADLLPGAVARERLEIETLFQAGIISDRKQFTTNYNRLRTKLYFKQKKYNLLREESEGFAKIITTLFKLNHTNVPETLDTVTQIIGRDRVDPNRILDLILQAIEFNSFHGQVDSHVEFLRMFYNDNARLTQLVLLKLNFFIGSKDSHKMIPQSFYRMLAVMIDKEILDLDDIYPHLKPDDGKALEHHNKLLEEGKSISRKYAMAVVGEEKPTKSVIDALREESPADFHFLEVDNHKVNLCAHLIDIGNWEQGLYLARKLPEYYCFASRRVAESACAFINYLIDPIYRDCGLPKPLNSKIKPARVPTNTSVAQCTTVEDLQNKLFPILISLGPFISVNILLQTKLIRILRHLLVQKQSDGQDLLTSEGPLHCQILDVIAYSILPSISLSNSNCCLARELWTLIRCFKYHVRYRLYYEWRDDLSNHIMLRNRGQLLLRAKHYMKRLSKETLRPTGRNISKLCYSNPVIILSYVLVQVQSYDNLINLVVDALRFLPPIALDSLIYCIIESLSDPNKNKKSFDGMALAPWLMSLSNFSSNIILRYKVEFTSFLEHIANQLKVGNSLDLVLLTDLIQKMTGIETNQALTDDRIDAMMGGDILRTEGAYYNQVKNTRKSSARLKEALIESRLAMPLCILMAQIRESLFFNQQEKEAPLKLIGKLYDQCQETLVQYGVFLATNLSINDYINFLPPLEKLMTEHKLDPDSAFFLARPMIFHKIKSKFNELKNQAAKELDREEGEAPELSSQTIGAKFVEAARSVIEPLAESIQPLLAEKHVSCNLNSKLFVVFWTFSMSDIEVPNNCYERELSRLKSTLSDLSAGLGSNNSVGNSNSNSGNSGSLGGKLLDDDPKRRKERDRCANLLQKLKQEQAEQLEHVRHVRMYLESEKNNLFCENSSYDNVYLESRQFVQHCPFARCLLTAQDAIYSARFMLFLHELKVENYPTIICLDRLLCDLTYMMGACTENEANHYGRFLCNILKTTSYWHSSAEVYNDHCEHYPGSIINIDNSEYINYETYRDICYKWHYRLTRSFSVALESSNYIQIRNALIVMISIIDHYPAIKHFGKGIGIKIEDVRNNEKENRQDLYALATAYAGRLEERKPHLIPESNFHTVDTRSSSSSTKDKHSSSSSSSSSRKKARH